MQKLFIGVIACLAIASGLWKLGDASRDLSIVRTKLGATPVTIFRPSTGLPAPAVVIAHGFAGSQQLMQPFAVTLARNGFVAVTFDFPGHGRNSAPLPGGLSDHDARSEALLKTLDTVVGFARNQFGVADRVALLGHSMASDIVVQYGMRHPEIAATVGVSLFSPGVTATRPRNLLVIDGAWEPAMLRDEGFRIVGMAAAAAPQESITYGNFSDGSARRLALADGVEHIAVLYSRESMVESLDWLNRVFDRPRETGFIDGRGPWLGLLFMGLLLLAYPLAASLPSLSSQPLGTGFRWRQLLPVAILPALLTPLILWKVPTDFLPILLGDYLALHYLVYGLLTGAGIWATRRGEAVSNKPAAPNTGIFILLAILATTFYGIFAIGYPLDHYVFNYEPDEGRCIIIFALLLATIPYFIADEWLTRGATSPRGAYALTKFCFLLSLVLAIGLNLEKLFFLAIIVPAILAFFLVYGFFSRWIYRSTNHPLVGAISNAAAFAWAIGVTFPFISR